MSSIAKTDFVAPEAPQTRWEAWREHVQPFFDLEAKPATDLSNAPSMSTYFFGSMMTGEVDAPAQMLTRKVRKVSAQGLDHILLQFYREGRSRVEHDGRSRVVGPSDVVIYDLGQPILVDTDGPVRATNVLFPRALLGDRIGDLDALHGATFRSDENAVAKLFHAFITDVNAQASSFAQHQARPISEAAARLCTACLPGAGAGERRGDLAMSIEIRQFIQTNLGDEDLDVTKLAARFGMSRASLYRLFAEEGGVQAYIRERRLLKAMRLLSRPVEGVRPRISAVGYACGFADAKTFSRAFAARFGILPREARAGEIGEAGPESRDGVLYDWINRLAA